jgi:hypothetical protein
MYGDGNFQVRRMSRHLRPAWPEDSVDDHVRRPVVLADGLLYKRGMSWRSAWPGRIRARLVVMGAAALLMAMVTPAHAAATVTCTYTFVTWPGGFSANVSIANNGPAINGWTVRWTFASPTTNIQAWSAIISERDAVQVSATNMSWNGLIPTGKVLSFGWSAAAITTAAPTDVTINGAAC